MLMECRICLEEGTEDNMISPCLCRGTSKWVHKDCLAQWRALSTNDDAKIKCLECNFEYIIERDNTDYCCECWNRTLNWITLNTIPFLILYQIIIILSAIILNSFNDFKLIDDFSTLINNFFISTIFWTILGFLVTFISFLFQKNKRLYCSQYTISQNDVIISCIFFIISMLFLPTLSIIFLAFIVQALIKNHLKAVYKIYALSDDTVLSINDSEINSYRAPSII